MAFHARHDIAYIPSHCGQVTRVVLQSPQIHAYLHGNAYTTPLHSSPAHTCLSPDSNTISTYSTNCQPVHGKSRNRFVSNRSMLSVSRLPNRDAARQAHACMQRNPMPGSEKALAGPSSSAICTARTWYWHPVPRQKFQHAQYSTIRFSPFGVQRQWQCDE